MAESRNRRSDSAGGGASRRKQGGGIKPALLVSLAAILILAVIFAVSAMDRKKKAAIESSEAEAASIAASIAESEAEEAAKKIDVREFKATEIPELTALVRDYFDARLAADTTRILELYGRSDTSADPELEKKLKAQAAWIQGFRNISVWDVAGVSEGDRLCLVQYDVDFRRTDTLAPGIMYFYAERSADGGYRFVETLMKDRVDFMEQELDSEQAAGMIADTDARLKEALDADSELALIYTSFRNGEIYRESDLDIDREQEVDLFLDPADSILVEGVELPQYIPEEETEPEIGTEEAAGEDTGADESSEQ